MNRYLYAVGVGLVGALVVHLAIIILLPTVSELSAWKTVESSTEENTPTLLTDIDISGKTFKNDPMMQSYVCRFDLKNGYFRVHAEGNPPFWSASVQTSSNKVAFSANDRIAPNGKLDIVVVNPAQQRALRQAPPAQLENAIVVPLSIDTGFVAVRAFQPDTSWEPVTGEFFSSMDCSATRL